MTDPITHLLSRVPSEANIEREMTTTSMGRMQCINRIRQRTVLLHQKNMSGGMRGASVSTGCFTGKDV
jgi:hypothetical protein